MARVDRFSLKQGFEELLDTWSERSWREPHPARKNRIQAISEIRERLRDLVLTGRFEADRKQLVEVVETCAATFEPVFETDADAVCDVHDSLLDLLARLARAPGPED